MVKERMLKKLLCFVGPGLITAFSIQAYAAGYKLEFQSASILAGSGEAAAVEDAGTNWYNAAGDVLLPRQSVISLIDLYAPTRFTGTTTGPSTIPGAPDAFGFVGNGSATAHSNTLLPAIHFVTPIMNRYALGLSIVPAWGFKENYGDTSILRYDLTSVYTKTIDISPSISMKVNDQWSLGVGPDFHYFSAQSESHVRTQPLTTPVNNTAAGDSIQRFTASAWQTGFHAGVLFRHKDQTRVGLAYRSKLVQHMDGYSDFALKNLANFESDDFTLRIVLPPTTTLSGYHQLTPRVAILGTIAYDQWGQLKSYNATNVVEPGGITLPVTLPQNMKNTFDFSVGSHYILNDKWMLRGSIKYLPTPTNDEDRDVNFPDGQKLGFQIGSRYKMNKRMAIDLIYGHVFVRQEPISITNPLTLSTSNGHTRSHIDFVGAQAVVNI